MRHRNHGRKLKRSPSHRRMLLRNLATSLLEHERIETTLAKAKEVQPFVEQLITLSKDGIGRDADGKEKLSNLNNFRRVLAVLTRKDVAYRLFFEVGPRFKGRTGGYTRIFKLAKVRQGDAAPMAVLSLLGEDEPLTQPKKARTAKASAPAASATAS